MSKAVDFLDDYVLWLPEIYKAPYTKYGPGQLVLQKMSPEQRELLKTLKSEDLQNIRPDSCWMYSPPRRRGRWGLQKD